MGSRKIHSYSANFGDDLAQNLIIKNTLEKDIVLDPFTGSSTTLIQARALGRSAIGIDIDPIACLIAKVVTENYTIEELNNISKNIIASKNDIEILAKNILDRKKLLQKESQLIINEELILFPVNKEIKYWFTPAQISVLVSLIKLSSNVDNEKHKRIIDLSISSSIIHKWPNTISLAKDIDHSRPHRVTRRNITIKSQLKIFLSNHKNVIRNLIDINKTVNSRDTFYKVLQGDACDNLKSLKENSVDYVLTSPPYFDAIDYPRAHKFSEWWVWPNQVHVKSGKYIGLKAGGKEKNSPYGELVQDLIPNNIASILPLKKIAGPLFRKLCLYIYDMNEVISNTNRVMKEESVLSLVIANNVVRNVKVPVVDIIIELLGKNGFKDIYSEERKIQENRRRYPYGIKGFNGLMNVEYIINCKKMIINNIKDQRMG
jgi:DNA modification methylase